MNVARLRELMNNLPDDMPVVVRGGIAGYDPLITAAVRLLGPTPVHFENYDGVLIEEHLDYQTRRPHFALGLSEQRECTSRRLHEANIEGYWDPEDAAWGISGWLDERRDWLAEMRCKITMETNAMTDAVAARGAVFFLNRRLMQGKAEGDSGLDESIRKAAFVLLHHP